MVDLIDVIYIHADKGVEIHFKFQDQHKRLMEFIDNNLAAAACGFLIFLFPFCV